MPDVSSARAAQKARARLSGTEGVDIGDSWASRDCCEFAAPDAFGFVARCCFILCQIGETAVDTLHRDIHITFGNDAATGLLEVDGVPAVLSSTTLDAFLSQRFGFIEVDIHPLATASTIRHVPGAHDKSEAGFTGA